MGKKKWALVALILAGLVLYHSQFYPKENVYVLLTVDVEQDVVPYLDTYLGVEKGLPQILAIFEEYGVRATFFVTARVAAKYPTLIRSIMRAGHEVASHGLAHENFTQLTRSEKVDVVRRASLILEEVVGVRPTSFRAPYGYASADLAHILSEEGYQVEATLDGSPYPHLIANTTLIHIVSAPIFYPSAVWPTPWTDIYEMTIARQEGRRPKVVVVNLHSWEVIDLPEVPHAHEWVRASGEYTRSNLVQLLSHLKRMGVSFVTMAEMSALLKSLYRVQP
jgi:peptidoglycan/xylan/chitin deacetylase (PgdA/CDA1 family)